MKELTIDNINDVMATSVQIVDAMMSWDNGGSEAWETLLTRFKDQVFYCDQMLIALAVCYMNRNDVSMNVMRQVMTPEEWKSFKSGIRPLTMAWVSTEPPIEYLKKIANAPDPTFFLDRAED